MKHKRLDLRIKGFAEQHGQRTARGLKFVTFVLQFFQVRKHLLQLRRVLAQFDAQFLRLHDDVAPASQVADQDAPPVAHQRRVNVLEAPRHLLHRVDVHAPFMGERRLAHPGLVRVVPEVRDLVHELRKLPQLRQRLLRHAPLLHLEGDIGDHAREVAVAGPLAVTIDGALDMRCAHFHRRQRIRHPESDVVMRMDAEVRV